MYDWTLPAFLAGAGLGYAVRWVAERPRQRRGLVLRSAFEQTAPGVSVVKYAAWNAHLVAFAKACAIGQRISERAVVSAGIVASEQDYRILARYMVRAGLWISRGRRQPKRWSDRHPTRIVGRVAGALYSGRMVLPYPTADPPPVYDRH